MELVNKDNIGFQIKRVIATGVGVPQASLEFSDGLNVITGASNTGKTYIFQAINFLLGGNDWPKETPESKYYDTLYLEIENSLYGPILIRREFVNTNPIIYYSTFNQLADKNQLAGKILPKKSSEKAGLSLADFILSICGAESVRAKSNQNNKTVAVSFRTIRHFFIVSETEILEEGSPTWLGQNSTKTLSTSLFKFLLSGQDDSGLKKIKDEKVFTSNSAKYNLLSELIESTSIELASLATEGYDKDTESKIKAKSEELEYNLNQTSSLEFERKELSQQANSIESEIVLRVELLNRFKVLKQHYESDIKRLDFISEGSYLIEQLEFTSCPFCFNPLTAYARHEACIANSIAPEVLYNSCKSEFEKLNAQLQDLQDTIKQVEKEHDVLTGNLLSLTRSFKLAALLISDTFIPKIKELQSEIQSLQQQHSASILYESTENRLNSLIEMRKQCAPQSNEKPHKQNENKELPINEVNEFCTETQSLLKSWGVSDGPVTFNYNTIDIAINSKDRKADGKGLRAITRSAFMVSLMKYCKRKSLPHTRMLILDSPITNYRENSKKHEDTNRIQNHIFRELSRDFASDQIIVFENKEPLLPKGEKINIINFGSNPETDRPGFFPTLAY